MLIGVQGVNGKSYGAVGIACSIAGFLALNRNRKTLILQFINKTPNSAEKLLIGNRLRSEQGNIDENDDSGYSDDGMDSLLRLVEGAKLMDADFSANCTPMNEKIKFLFDVANVTMSNDFIKDLMERMDEGENNIVERLIKSAADDEVQERVGIYSNVILIIESSNVKFAAKIKEFVDYSIYCVPQGFAQKNVRVADKKKEIIVVNDFDTDSKFSLKTMKKEYYVKKVYPVVHNVGYKDALLAGTLLSFIRKNRECEANDKNYEWKKSISEIVTFLVGKEVEPEKLYTKELKYESPNKELLDMESIPYQEIEEIPKKTLFGPKRKRKVTGVVITE